MITKDSAPREFLIRMLPENGAGMEIGVHRGDFSSQILEIAKPSEMHLVDPWQYESSETYERAWYGGKAEGGQHEMDTRYRLVCDKFKELIAQGRVIVHRAYAGDALSALPDNYLDWVYIDGNHLYDYVKQDLELSLRKIKPGGLITGDDYTDGGWWKGGVKQAVDEFAKNDAVELIELRNAQFVFRKK